MKLQYRSAYRGLPREVYFLFAAKLVNCAGMFISPLLTLILTQKLAMSKADAGGMVAFFLLTQAPCVILGGRLADTIGRKKTFAAGSLLGALAYIACGCGAAGRPMVYLMILAADMVAVAAPSFDAMTADFTPPEQRQRAFSLLYLGINIGMAASPILGGLLFQNHLRLLFFFDAATTVTSVAIILWGVGEPHRGAAVSGPAPAQRRSSLASALRAAPVLLGFVLLMFCYDFCYSQWNFMLPAQFGDLFGPGGARLFSLLGSANAVTVILLTPLVTLLTRRMRPLAAVAAGGLLFAAAFLGFAAGGPYPLYLLYAEVFTLGEICTTIQIGAFLSNHAPADCLGRVSAFSSIVRGTGAALGPMVMGGALGLWEYRSCWLWVLALMLAGSLGMFLLGRRDTSPRGA